MKKNLHPQEILVPQIKKRQMSGKKNLTHSKNEQKTKTILEH